MKKTPKKDDLKNKDNIENEDDSGLIFFMGEVSLQDGFPHEYHEHDDRPPPLICLKVGENPSKYIGSIQVLRQGVSRGGVLRI